MDPRERLRRLRHVALDLDGTLYKDGEPFDCTKAFLERLRELGIGRTFVTNNSARSSEEYIALLREAGIEAEVGDVYSSTLATLAYLKRELPRVRRLFVLGTESPDRPDLTLRDIGELGELLLESRRSTP